MMTLCLLNIFWYPGTWWIWFLLGVAGVFSLAWSTSRNHKLVQQMSTDLLQRRLDAKFVTIPELQANVARAMHHHRSISKMINERPENMSKVVDSLDEWAVLVFDVTKGLDTVLSDPNLLEQTRGVLREEGATEALDDPLNAVVDAAAFVARAETQADNPNRGRLMMVHNVVGRVRDELSSTLDRVVNINEALRRARELSMAPQHVEAIEETLRQQLNALMRTQDAVQELGAVYSIDLD